MIVRHQRSSILILLEVDPQILRDVTSKRENGLEIGYLMFPFFFIRMEVMYLDFAGMVTLVQTLSGNEHDLNHVHKGLDSMR